MPYRPFLFNLLTHDRLVVDTSIRSLVVPAQYGSPGILAHHSPMVAILVGGVVSFETDSGERRELDISSGILTVENNKATVLADAILE